MNKPKLTECFTDNGEHSHWILINAETGEQLWSESDPEDQMIAIEWMKFRRGDIYDIYECERDKTMFFNREAGFIVQTYGDKNQEPEFHKFSESILYESYPSEIRDKKNRWEGRMNKAISLWKGINN